jgi:hypothetical protein
MIKKILRDSLLISLCFAALNSLAQQKCPFKSISINPFFAGYPDRDSLLQTEILGTRKLAIKNDGFEVISFQITTDGNCIGGALYTEVHCNSNEITSEAAALLKRAEPGQKLFLDHVRAANDSGQIYCLQTVPFYISKPKVKDSCPTLPYKAFIAGHPDATRLTVAQLLKGGRLVTNASGYEITGFVIGASVTRGAMIWCGEISNTGADFSDEIKNLLRNLEPGHVFLIGNVYVRNQAGQTFCLDAVKMTVR